MTALMSEPANGNKASTAPSFGTKDDTAARSVFVKRTRWLMRCGLIRGITPMSIRKGSSQGYLGLVFSPPDGSTCESGGEMAGGIGHEQKAGS
jgi:hypothetical protein